MTPKVSVVMSVYNGAKYLPDAIESILNQTLKNFEFIIINDGSTDTSKKIIESYADPRIKLIDQTNHGLVYSLNRGLKEARAEYIARMDADDISLPERIEQQADFLDNNPEVALLGTSFEIIDEQGKYLDTAEIYPKDLDIKRALFIGNIFGHGTIMMRKQAFIEAGGYRQAYWPVEDYDLWARLAFKNISSNLPYILYRWRVNPQGITAANSAQQSALEKKITDEIWGNEKFPAISAKEMYLNAMEYKKISKYYPFRGNMFKSYLIIQIKIVLTLLTRKKYALAFINLLFFTIYLSPLLVLLVIKKVLKKLITVPQKLVFDTEL